MNASKLSTLIAAFLGLQGCTGQLPGSFRLLQAQETFHVEMEVNTRIDLLWVVDNSSSMDVSQERLRQGFASFAGRYLTSAWDIRMAVITTDAYLANPAFAPYLASTVPFTQGWTSPYISGRLSTFVNPRPGLVNLTTGIFDSGVRFNDLVPIWGPTYARLLPGIHDGPIPGFCFEALPYFLSGVTQCAIRDDRSRGTGTAGCLHPGVGQSSLTQCVNTTQNNTVHTGSAILSTLGAPSAAIRDSFLVNVTTGSAGHGSERGMGSLLQMLSDNEPSQTSFFRAGSLRGIVFVSDEDDQTLTIETPPSSGFNPWSHYGCDQAGLLSTNGAAAVTGSGGACCTDPAQGCRFGSEGISCASKTVDGLTYTPSFCPRTDLLMPVATVKSRLDSFFLSLDGAGARIPNYFVTAITPLTGDAIVTMQASRDADDVRVNGLRTAAVDRGDRYIDLVNRVGFGSSAMNIADADYSPILDSIGRTLVLRKGTFALEREPTGTEDMFVKIQHGDGTTTTVRTEQYEIREKTLTLTDLDLILGFVSTDRISVSYQPKTVY